MSPKVARNVAVLAFPFTSHPFSLLRFVHSVSNLAPDMQFTFFNTARSNSSLFSGFGNINDNDNIRPYNAKDGMPEGDTSCAARNTPEHELEMFGENAPSNFEMAIKEVEAETGHKFDLLISDAFLCWFASVLAKRMHVNWVPFWASTQRCLLTFLQIDKIKEKMGVQGQEDAKSLDFLPGFSNEFLASDLPAKISYGKQQPPFAAMLYKMGQELPQATMVVINSFEAVDIEITMELKKKLKKCLLVGPQHLVIRRQRPNSNDDDWSAWLDKHEHATVAYISFGTETTLAPMEVAALADALVETQVPFVWSYRGNKEEFPQGFIERTERLTLGKLVSWVDQERILNHPSIGVFVTHCGWGSISEGITSGVPFIGKPIFADQYMNMRSVEVQWKIGVRIEGGVFTKDRAVKALEQVLLLENGKEMRKRAEILKHMALEAVGPNGSSTQDLKAFVDIIKS